MPTVSKDQRNNIRPVRNERDRKAALARIDELMRINKLTPSQEDELEVLFVLVGSYEREKFPHEPVTPEELLQSLVEDAGHKQKDIAKGAGIATSTISEILHGKRKINARQAVALGKYFKVRPDAFLPK